MYCTWWQCLSTHKILSKKLLQIQVGRNEEILDFPGFLRSITEDPA